MQLIFKYFVLVLSAFIYCAFVQVVTHECTGVATHERGVADESLQPVHHKGIHGRICTATVCFERLARRFTGLRPSPCLHPLLHQYIEDLATGPLILIGLSEPDQYLYWLRRSQARRAHPGFQRNNISRQYARLIQHRWI